MFRVRNSVRNRVRVRVRIRRIWIRRNGAEPVVVWYRATMLRIRPLVDEFSLAVGMALGRL